MAAVTICSDFEAQKNKVWHCFYCFPIYFPWRDGPDAIILVFWMLSFKYIQKLVDDTSSWEKENHWVASSTPLSPNKENVGIKRTFYPDVEHACMPVARHLNPWTVAHQAPLSMGFSRQEYCSGWSYPPPGDLPHPGIEPTSLIFPALAGVFITITTTR